jgi:hypothetical protein
VTGFAGSFRIVKSETVSNLICILLLKIAFCETSKNPINYNVGRSSQIAGEIKIHKEKSEISSILIKLSSLITGIK